MTEDQTRGRGPDEVESRDYAALVDSLAGTLDLRGGLTEALDVAGYTAMSRQITDLLNLEAGLQSALTAHRGTGQPRELGAITSVADRGCEQLDADIARTLEKHAAETPMLYRSIVVVDVAGFTRPDRAIEHQDAVRRGLYHVLQAAFADVGVDWDSCHVEDRGDGAMILVPPEVPKNRLVALLPGRLVAGLRRHNAVYSPEAAIQLRVALHAGEVYQDNRGVVSQAVNVAFRILDAPQAKSALRSSTGVLAFLASDTFYRDVILQDPATDPGSYWQISVPVSEGQVVAWLCLPDHLRLPDQAAPVTSGLGQEAHVPVGPQHDSSPAARSKVEQKSRGPVAEFCTGLRRLQEGRGLGRSALARRLGYSRSQLYAILDGRISRPPEWDRLVEPLVRACTGNDERAVAAWRQRYEVLLEVYHALRAQHRQEGTLPARLRVVPAQLPADVDVFTGRAQELADLDRLLTRTLTPSGAAGGTSICAITGTAGVGKTALALRWAHRVRKEFPEGQLYVNLRGYDPDAPMSAGDALAGFLRALGLPEPDIPLEVEERAAAYRSLLTGRRMLVVLDNAATVEQLRPLLPGTGSCVVLVTSRDSLAGLVARHGARRCDLSLLPSQDAVALLQALIGERIEAEPDAALTLAGQCARLPLALRVAAELAAARPATSLAELVSELGDEQQRLRLLDAGGDPRTAVRTVFSWSYQHLPAEAARAFRRLGLHPGPDLDPYATAALTYTSRDHAHDLLDLLARAHLVEPARSGRYGMHDLLRAYAADLATTQDGKDECRAARTNLFDYYLCTATAAMDTLHRVSGNRRPRVRLVHPPIPSMAESATALAWLNEERPNLVAICAYTATYGWPSHTIRLAATLSRYVDRAGFFPDAVVIHSHARRAAYEISDRAGEAHAVTSLGMVHARQGRYEQAVEHLQQAIVLFREIDNRGGEARALNKLGLCRWRQGRYGLAIEDFQLAITLFREIDDRGGEAHALSNLGLVHWRQGHYEQAIEHHWQALTLFRAMGDHNGEANALANLGTVYGRQGRYEQAADHLQQAIAIHREIGDRIGKAYALEQLGVVSARQGRYEQATEHLRQALTLFHETGHRDGEPQALNSLGETLHATGQPEAAHTQHTAALTLAIDAGDRYEQARAHAGLGQAHHATGDSDQARHHWHHALTLYTDLGVPDTQEWVSTGNRA